MVRRPPARRPRLNPETKLFVWLAFTLTIILIACALFLATVPEQTPNVEKLTEGFSTAAKMGAGAIFGLVQGARSEIKTRES